ncbi:hypothetical protein ACFLU6_14655, partial [Acidobacteriota bacterium]
MEPSTFTTALPLAQAGSRGYLLELIGNSGPFAIFILLTLLAFLIISTGIIADKLLHIARARQQSAHFLQIFRGSQKFSEVKAVCKKFSASPLVGLFLAGFNELEFQLQHQDKAEEGTSGDAKPVIRSMEGISRALSRASAVEL